MIFLKKVIAFYLPQFHSIPENDAVWGKGFTEWNNVKSAKRYTPDQQQPRVPLNDNYYNLLNENTLKWQTDTAREYGVYGFCIYHYWFSRKLLLNKPLELLRDSQIINFPYCICWANESWTNAWVAKDKPKSFLEQKYGDKEEWKDHYNYLATFFHDENYIVSNNRPLLVIYRPETITCLNEMLDYWTMLAKEDGFEGITYAYQQVTFALQPGHDESRFSYSIEYQPKYALEDMKETNSISLKLSLLKRKLKPAYLKIESTLGLKLLEEYWQRKEKSREENGPKILDYENVSQQILNRHARNEKSIPGMFVGYDDTPRKGRKGTIIQSDFTTFKKIFEKQIKNMSDHYQTDMLFIFAWNEWAEGGYLEPDKQSGYKYLEAIKDTLNKDGE